MYKIFLILRYLTKKTLILLSMGGVAVAVMVFIVVFSVLEGFGQNIRQRLRGTISDIVVEDISGNGLENYEEIIREAEADNPHIEACSPFIERIAMFQEFWERREPVREGEEGDIVYGRGRRLSQAHYGLVRGIDPEREGRTGRLERFLRDGNYYRIHGNEPLSKVLRPGSNAVLVGDHEHAPGRMYAENPGRYLFAAFRHGDVAFVKPEGSTLEEKEACMQSRYGDDYRIVERALVITSAVTRDVERASYGKYEVAGTFKTGGYEYDSALVYMNIEDAQVLLNMAGSSAGEFAPARKPVVTGINVKLDSYENMESARATMERILERHGANCRVRGWTEVRKNMLSAIAIEKAVAVVILTCIVMVMGFGIFAILSLSSAQKAPDIGILKSLGATNGGVLAIFLAMGLTVGVVGSLAGTALGIFAASKVNKILGLLKYLGWEVFPGDVFYFDKIPSIIRPEVYGSISVITVLISLIASIAPAVSAARRDPTKTLIVQ